MGVELIIIVLPCRRNHKSGFMDIEWQVIPNTAVFGPTNFIGTTTTIASTARMKISTDEDFYGGRTLDKFYLFIFC